MMLSISVWRLSRASSDLRRCPNEIEGIADPIEVEAGQPCARSFSRRRRVQVRVDAVDAFEHWCEVCGTTAALTSAEAYRAGWDFPPRMGEWGVISPRTCGSCPMSATVWWAVAVDGYDSEQLSPSQRATIARLLDEKPDEQATARSTARRTETRERLEFAEGGSWIISTKSGSHYLLKLDADERTVIRLTVDEGTRTPTEGSSYDATGSRCRCAGLSILRSRSVDRRIWSWATSRMIPTAPRRFA